MKSTMIRYIPVGGLERRDIEALRTQGVTMDNWDYLLVVSGDDVAETPFGDIQPHDWHISRLLHGIAHNKWYRAHFHGKVVGIGVSYHA